MQIFQLALHSAIASVDLFIITNAFQLATELITL